MTNNSLLSIIIPSYNNANACQALVDTLQTQTYPANWDIEIIICDDGSSSPFPEDTNNTQRNLTLIRHPKNRGRSAARNTALKQVQGQFVLFLDADTRLETNDILSHYIQAIEDQAEVISTDLIFKGNERLTRYQNRSWSNHQLKTICGLCIKQNLITHFFDEDITSYGFEDKLFIWENGLGQLPHHKITACKLTHYDTQDANTLFRKMASTGEKTTPIMRSKHKAFYQTTSYYRADTQCSHLKPLLYGMIAAIPLLLALHKLNEKIFKSQILFNHLMPVLSSAYFAKGTLKSKSQWHPQ